MLRRKARSRSTEHVSFVAKYTFCLEREAKRAFLTVCRNVDDIRRDRIDLVGMEYLVLVLVARGHRVELLSLFSEFALAVEKGLIHLELGNRGLGPVLLTARHAASSCGVREGEVLRRQLPVGFRLRLAILCGWVGGCESVCGCVCVERERERERSAECLPFCV